MPNVNYHCVCRNQNPVPPPPHLASSSYSFHPLKSLFYCEDCDALRCNRCVSVEVSGYYCPNCLFEVPSASVRAEKNRCARNCFICPTCSNTLSVVPSDPPDAELNPTNVLGEPPYFLYCSFCRWDSAEVGITFEKSTGLAAQLQRTEDSSPDFQEFERLKEHFDPIIRASSGHSHLPTHYTKSTRSSATAAASAALARDITGVGKYSATPRSRAPKDKSVNKDEMPEYKTRVAVGGLADLEGDIDVIRDLENADDVASLSQMWTSSWRTSTKSADLYPSRIPLHSKVSKRCPTCVRILTKPEQKAQSVRYKIKLMASGYLPSITASLVPLNTLTVRRPLTRSPQPPLDEDKSPLIAGQTYGFKLAIKNPHYDPIVVRLSGQRMHVSTAANEKDKARRPPFALSLPTAAFSVAAYNEGWELEDDDDDPEVGGADDDLGRKFVKDKDLRKTKAVGVLEKKANMTIVGGEVVIGKEARGAVRFNMLVTYTYKQDNLEDAEISNKSSSKGPDTKTSSFYTVVDLGFISDFNEEV